MTETADIVAPAPRTARKAFAFLRRELDTPINRILLATLLIFWLAVYLVAPHAGGGVTVTKSFYSFTMYLAFGCFAVLSVLWRLLYVMIAKRPRRLFAAIAEDFRDVYLNPHRLLTGIPIFIFLPIFFSLFTSAKNLIPLLNPFYLDPMIAELERLLHFGKQPWQWLHPVLGIAAVSSFISALYKTWFIMKYGVCFWQAFATKRPRLREQFLLTYIFSWIVLGVFFAFLLSSAGPCFYGNLYPDAVNPYADLMAYLHKANETHPIYELRWMEYLWHTYTNREAKIFSGISAMPSMHVSVAFLFVLLGWHVHRAFGVLFTAYFFAILIGSVHLGWHYALDGYVSVVVTYLIWLIVGRFTGRDDVPAPQQSTAACQVA